MVVFKQKKTCLAALFAVFIVALTFSSSSVQAAPSASQVGYVDFIYLVDHHPDTAKANEVLKAEQEAAIKEFAEKPAGLGDKEKLDLDRQLGLRVEQKRLELLKLIADKVLAAVKEEADAQGLLIVIGNKEVVYGGMDITAEVLKKIGGK